jgi:hypothetical protein
LNDSRRGERNQALPRRNWFKGAGHCSPRRA